MFISKELCEAKSSYAYNLDVHTGTHPTNSEYNTAFSVVDRLYDKREGALRVHGQMVFQPKDLQPFMGLQNKGCRHSDVQKKRNA